MISRFEESIRQQCKPLHPSDTGTQPKLTRISGIRVVLFDIYGTLLISSSGDLQAKGDERAADAFVTVLGHMGLSLACSGTEGLNQLRQTIETEHQRARAAGIEYPEVEIRAVWTQTLTRMHGLGLVDAGWQQVDVTRLALEYELRANPVWPMPHARDCLVRLFGSGLRLGLISNAQFMTPQLLSVLLNENQKPHFEWDAELQFFSWQLGRAKPGMKMFHAAVERLSTRDIQPDETLYVGNDMLNDIWTGQRAGFRTALFAGDQRSLRWRLDDPRIRSVEPDLVVTDLDDLPKCVCE